MTRRRESLDVKAEDVRRLLNDPVFVKAIADEERGLIAKIANHVCDGSDQSERQQLELCRELRTITNIKRRLLTVDSAQILHEASQPSNNG